MSTLLQIQAQLDKVNRNVAELERAVAEHPGYPSIAANLESAVRIQKKLQMQFAEVAASVGVEICKYRAFADQGRTNAGAAFGAVAEFQRLFSVVFGSLKYGMKQRARIGEDLEKETAFGFAYAVTESVGVVLTVRRDADIFDESYVDETMKAIFEMAKSDDPRAMQAFAEKLGPGAINALYQWADSNAAHGLGADIEWRHGNEIRGSLFLQRQQLSKLRTAIERTSSDQEQTITIEGVLDGALVSRRRFVLKREGMPDIRGTVAVGAIDANHEVRLPRGYAARLLKTTRTHYATGKQKVKYHLLGLTEVAREAKHDTEKTD